MELPAASVTVAPDRSTSPVPAVVMAPAVTVVSVMALKIVEDRLLLSPIVSIEPLLIVIVELLPTLLSCENWLLALMVRFAADGLLLVLSSKMPAASFANTFRAPRFTVPESMVIAPETLAAVLILTVPEPENVKPPLPVICDEIVGLVPLS